MTLRDTWLSFLRAIIAMILALGPAVAFAFLLTAAELPPGIALTPQIPEIIGRAILEAEGLVERGKQGFAVIREDAQS